MEHPAVSYIKSRLNSAMPDQSAILSKLLSLYEGKLWHQLTQALQKIVNDQSLPNLLELYREFVKDFEGTMNPVSLSQIIISIVRVETKDAHEGLAFFENLEQRKCYAFTDVEAKILLDSEMCRLKLRKGETRETKVKLDTTKANLDTLLDPQELVQAAYYQAAAEYYKVTGPASEFYKNALMYMAYSGSSEDISQTDRIQWAFDLGIAALIGEDIYNFGELLANSICASLEKTDHKWLYDLLKCFSVGDIDGFENICNENAVIMNTQPILVANADFMRQKITILGLMDLAFKTTNSRTLSFQVIAQRCSLPIEEVEYLLMRGMSLKLIEGTIDSVDEVISIKRVQPRILGRDAIAEMSNRLDIWCKNVNHTLDFMESESTELVN